MTYEGHRAAMLAALVQEDPMGLADPDNDLADEYDAEAREIARRLVHAGGDPDAEIVATAISETFEEAFGTRLPADRVTGVVRAYLLGESGLGDRRERHGDADDQAAEKEEGWTFDDQLWDCWLHFSGLTVRDGTVRIPVSRSVQRRGWTTAESPPDRVLAIGGAMAVDVRESWDVPEQLFDRLEWDWGEDEDGPVVRIYGEPGLVACVRGEIGGRLRVELHTLATRDGGIRAAPSVALLGPDGRTRTFSDIDEARRELRDERVMGEHRGHDADGFRVTVEVTDESGPFRRRTRVRRLLGPRIEVTSTTTAERVFGTPADDVRGAGASG